MSFFDRFKQYKDTTLNVNTESISAAADRIEERLLEELIQREENNTNDLQTVTFFVEELKAEILLRHQLGNKNEREEPDAEDAFTRIYVTEDKMTAFACVLPPLYGGAAITVKKIYEDLYYEGVAHGIDEERLKSAAKQGLYEQIFVIARGKPPINGQDGQLTECVEKRPPVDFKSHENGSVNFAKLDELLHIGAGEVICNITHPKFGTEGKDVIGRGLSSKCGKKVKIPQGENTVLSEDGTRLVAEIEGIVSYSNDAFHIEEKRFINRNIYERDGVFRLEGDVLIKGNISKGATIRAEGDLIICGSVDEADVEAKGNIYIQQGISGNDKGVLKSGGDIQSRSIENTNVMAEGNIYAEVIMNCTVNSGGSIFVTGGRGMIIGGSVSSAKSIEAKKIGNQSNCMNRLTIGYSLEREKEEESIEKELKSTAETLEKIRKNVLALKGITVLSPEKKEVLEQLEQQKNLYRDKEKKLSQKLRETRERHMVMDESQLISETIYPITIVNAGNRKLVVEEPKLQCKITVVNKELRLLKY